MKRALVFYLWGRRNAGDMAICLGAATLLIESGYHVTFVSRFSENQFDYSDSKEFIEGYFNEVNVKPGLLTFDRDDSRLDKFSAYIKGMLKISSPVKDSKLMSLIQEADIVFMNGGNQLRGNSFVDYARIFALFYPFELANKVGKRIVCLPQSSAKTNKFGYWLLKKKLSMFDKVFIRESNSYSKLTERIKLNNFVKTTDLGFYITDNILASKNYTIKYGNLINGEDNVALVLRSTTIGDIGEFSEAKKEEYSNLLLSYIDSISNRFNIYLVVQTKKDKEFTDQILSKINSNKTVKLIEEYDALVLREVYKRMKFVVAMRLHAAILAMTASTPVVGYFNKEWGFKNPGIMGDVGMPWTYDGSELPALSELLLNDYEKYQNNIIQFIKTEKQKIVSVI